MKIDYIIYTSNTGFTKAYAELLGKELNIKVLSLDKSAEVPKKTPIVYLGWLMAGKVKGLKKAEKRYDIKVLCGVGMSDDKDQMVNVIKKNRLSENTPVFCLQGGFELEKLHGLYKFMMTVMKKTVGKGLSEKADRTPEEEKKFDMLMNGGNMVSLENLKEVIKTINE